ncbi:hypothetical protein RRG08_061633 [Elysia crispata]|uniref:Uncharacterized protein n=1 Tax=Elysia crispata TaxID=231223 RepID=A0AAE0YV19_9GAST|nr:hypothetical protein RRG08_061633 [Elysia crispata]
MVGSLQFLTVNKRQVLKLACVATFFSILFFSVLSPNYLSFVRAPISQPTQDSITPSHWIIITTVAPPTADVMHMASLPGWRIVVVGDEKTLKNWSYPNCVYLSLSDQSALGFELTARLPVRSYSRKNLGYLYAVLHGAKVIFDTDDDNRPLDSLKSFIYSPTTAGLVVDNQDRSVFNPYHHFGQPTLWPRGFPLTAINNQRSYGSYRLSAEVRTPIIQQGIVAGDPDLDAIFRITRKGVAPVFDVTYDPVSPAVFLPAGTSAAHSTLKTFSYTKHSGLFSCQPLRLSESVIFGAATGPRDLHGKLEVLWVSPLQMLISPGTLIVISTTLLEETQMYFQTERLLDFLSSWVLS